MPAFADVLGNDWCVAFVWWRGISIYLNKAVNDGRTIDDLENVC